MTTPITKPMTDIDIARAATPRPVSEIADKAGIPEEVLQPYGKIIAKVDLGWLKDQKPRKGGKLILVTAMSPTPAGEGKTTTSVGLADGLRRIGKEAVLALREPSLGPCFGVKGGATGGGYAQVLPMEAINLHFTGDLHAIGAATNLLAAMIDNHLHWGNEKNIDPRKIRWNRAVDMNDRSLRHIVQGLDAPMGGGIPRESAFDITVAAETMAVFCLSQDLADLQERLAKMVVAESRDGTPVTAGDLGAAGAMAALLRDALAPNLVQTLEGTPAFIHGGPFANIAHGCNSVIATNAARALGDYTVTEAGFGADLGAEKFLDIAGPAGGFSPDAAVVVSTIRALKMHGGVAKADLGKPDPDAVRKGFVNLARHLDNLERFGLTPVVAMNRFPADTEEETAVLETLCEARDVRAVRCTHWAEGGKGAQDLAQAVVDVVEGRRKSAPPEITRPYSPEMPLFAKMTAIAKTLYHAGEVSADPKVLKRLKKWEEAGYGHLPVCMAKTPASFSTDPAVSGAPDGHAFHVRDVRLSAGAGFVVALCGEIVTMPGLPGRPAACDIGLDENGGIYGLF